MCHRLLSNYEYQENTLTLKLDIIKESEKEKENFEDGGSPLSSVFLGRLIKEIWKGRVRSVQTKKGKKQREKAFVNLVKKSTFQGKKIILYLPIPHNLYYVVF